MQSLLLQYVTGQDRPVETNSTFWTSLGQWPPSGANSTLANFTATGIEVSELPVVNQNRCELLNSIIADPSDGV
jgi:hypothetical protein